MRFLRLADEATAFLDPLLRALEGDQGALQELRRRQVRRRISTANATADTAAPVVTVTTVDKPSNARRGAAWASSFVDADPRHQIREFFMPGDDRGPAGLLKAQGLSPRGPTSHFFSVWRPTSLDAIRMMITGRATGKGLNIKGKSAKTGVLSGLVPFLQISEAAHKSRLGTSPAHARIRVYFATAAQRDAARAALQPTLDEMVAKAAAAQEALDSEWRTGEELEEHVRQALLRDLRYVLDGQPEMDDLDCAGCAGRALTAPRTQRLEYRTHRRTGGQIVAPRRFAAQAHLTDRPHSSERGCARLARAQLRWPNAFSWRPSSTARTSHRHLAGRRAGRASPTTWT